MEEDQPRMKVSGTQANTWIEDTHPPSRPQDSRVEYGEGGPPPQVTWRQETWPTANSLFPVNPPGSAKEELQRLDTTQEDFTRIRECLKEAGEVKEELPKQRTELKDDNRAKERPDEADEAKEEPPKQGTELEDDNRTRERPDKEEKVKCLRERKVEN